MRAVQIGIIIFFLVIGIFVVWKLTDIDIFETGKPVKSVYNHSIVLEKIEELGKLELVKFSYRDVIEHIKEYKNWITNSKVVLIVSGEAVGCIDLKKITKTNIDETRKDTIILQMPEPELCYYKIDQSKSRIYDSSYGMTDAATVIGEAYKAAEINLRKTALESGILEQTKKNAETMLKPLLEGLSKKKIIFKYPSKVTKK